jgi:polysaccharide export outer membrane protein
MLRAVLLLAITAASTACAETGTYVWFSELPPDQRQMGDHGIVPGDLVDVRVLGHDDMNVHQRVRGDGRISLPIIGDVNVAGTRPSALKGEIEGRLKDYIVSPSVTVSVEEALVKIACLGEVSKPGAYAVDPGAGLAEALAVAGGLTEYASRDRIFLIRQQPTAVRIRFTYAWLVRNEGQAAAFPLRAGDLVVVE